MIYLSNAIGQNALERFLQDIPEKALNLGIRIVFALIVLFIGAQIIKFARKLLKKTMEKAHADQGVITFVDSFVKAAMYVILVLLIASYFGVDAASIIALVGSAGVAVGLALQGSLSNLAGGVLLLVLKPFAIGDYIVDSAGNEGSVEEIQIFFTKLRTPDNKVIILPNGNLANNSIVNVTTSKIRRCDITVGISYNSDIKKAKDVLLNLLENDPAVLKDKDIVVFVDQLGDSSVNLGVRCWFSNDDFWAGKWRLTENVKLTLDEAGITIPFPQMDVHIQNQ